jgi:hypothetical protein
VHRGDLRLASHKDAGGNTDGILGRHRSPQLAIVVPTRSWREISWWKTQQTKNSLNFPSTCLKVVDTRRGRNNNSPAAGRNYYTAISNVGQLLRNDSSDCINYYSDISCPAKVESMPSPFDVPVDEWKTPRFLLALLVTGISILAVTVLAAVIIVRRHDPDAPQNVLNSVLPLLGTWVGTILVYYFSKENFETATQSVTALAKQLTPQQMLQSTPVRAKMIPRSQMFVQKAPASNLKLTDVLNKLEQEKKGNRVPVLGDKDNPKHIVHRCLIDSYLTGLARSGKSTEEITAQTLQNMLDGNSDIKRIAESFAVEKTPPWRMARLPCPNSRIARTSL